MNQCPCGSDKDYSNCCAKYIDGEQSAPSPELLMRSRYTAYTLARMDYIRKTMQGKPLKEFDERSGRLWAKKVAWINLKIINSSMASIDKGYVEFAANFVENDRIHTLQEVSEFHCEQGVWFYVDGVLKPQEPGKQPILRNTPCPCGSQKKFKNCHANRH